MSRYVEAMNALKHVSFFNETSGLYKMNGFIDGRHYSVIMDALFKADRNVEEEVK